MPPLPQPSELDLAALARAMGEETEPDSVLANVGRFISRPLYAFNSLLSGEPVNALENLGQMALDLPTGGFLSRDLSLANLFSETGDLTDRSERPEASDVASKWGFGIQPGIGRTVVDVVGGMALDPLTYLTLGGSGLAKAGLSGVSRGVAGARVAKGLEEAGSAARLLEGTDDALRGFAGRRGLPVESLDELRRLGDDPGALYEAGLLRGVRPGVSSLDAVDTALSSARGRLAQAERGIRSRAGVRALDEAIPQTDEVASAAQRLYGETLRGEFRRALRDDSLTEFMPRTGYGPPMAPLPGTGRLAYLRRTIEKAGGALDDGPDAVLARLEELVTTGEKVTPALQRLYEETAHAASVAKDRAAVRAFGPSRSAAQVGVSGFEGQRFAAEAGVEALQRGGQVYDASAVLVGLPFGPKAQIPGTAGFWGAVGKATAPYLAAQAVKKLAPASAPMIDQAAKVSWNWLKHSLYDKKAFGFVPESARDVLRAEDVKLARRNENGLRLAAQLFGDLAPEQEAVFTQALQKASGIYDEAAQGNAKIAAQELAARAVDQRQSQVRLLKEEVAQSQQYLGQLEGLIRQGLGDMGPARETRKALKKELAQAGTRLKEAKRALSRAERDARKAGTAAGPAADLAGLKARLGDEVVGEIASGTGLAPERVKATLDDYFKATDAMHREAEGLGVSFPRREFYVPQQADMLLAEFMAQGAHSGKFRKAIANVFHEARKYSPEELRNVLVGLATKYEIPIPAADVIDERISRLFLRRQVAHNLTLHHGTATRELQQRFGLRPGTDLDRYLRHQFEGMGARENVVQKILGGGKWEIPATSEWAKEAKAGTRKDVSFRVENGVERAFLEVPGINALYKPALTVLWPNFHARNAIGAMVQSMFDPDIGPSVAVKGMLLAVRDGMVLTKLLGKSSDESARILRAIHGDQEALASLGNVRVGRYTAQEVVTQAQGVLANNFAANEILKDADLIPQVLSQTDPKVLEHVSEALKGKAKVSSLPVAGWKDAVQFGARVAAHVEDSFRLQAFMGLIEKGVDLTDAARRVNKAYVDYSYQSPVERWVRDLIPFARFSLGMTPVVAEQAARRPATFTPLARLMGSTQSQGEGAFLPEYIREGVAIPLGTDAEGNQEFLPTLGLPQEQIANLGAFSPEGFRRQVLAGLQPALRTPLEASTGQSFYFGNEFGSYRRAPESLGRLEDLLGVEVTDRYTTKEGIERREVPGWVNAWALGATPLNRFVRFADQWFDKRRSVLDNVVETASGAKIRSVDQRTEAKKVILRFLEEAAREGKIGEIERFFEFDGREVPPAVKAALQAQRQIAR